MTRATLKLFGGFDLRDGSGMPVTLPTRKAEALFAYLALNRGQPQPRERLAAIIWDQHSEQNARANLRKTLSRIRPVLPKTLADALIISASHLTLEETLICVDVCEFEDFVAAGAPDSLEHAVQLCRARLLDGVAPCSETFDEWLESERRRLDEANIGALRKMLDHYVVCGVIDRAIQLALRLLGLDTLDEGVHRTLIRLYLYQDRIGSAAQQYETCAAVLARDLGVEPAPETQTLYAEVLRQLPDGHDALASSESDTLPERTHVIEAGIRNRDRLRETLRQGPSIAVLPFKVLGDESPGHHIGELIVEDVITELGRFRELDVIAPASVFAYRGVSLNAENTGDALGARHVLEGTLRPRRDGLRITTRLLETATARQIWATNYDCAMSELVDVQDDLVLRIVGELVGQVELARLDETKRKPPDDWMAYDYWLRGRTALRESGVGALAKARDYFNKAIERDPDFARAYIGLAATNMREWSCYAWNHWAFLQEEALELAQKAVEIDERDHHALCMLSMMNLYSGNYDTGGLQIAKAVDLNPNDADVLAHAAVAYPLLGELDAGVDAGRRALKLSPHHPEWYVSFAGFALLAARQYEEAVETLAPAPEAICDTPAYLAASYAYLGRTGDAKAHRDTLYRHLNNQIARGWFPEGMSCADWLLEMAPFRRDEDAEHYREGLRRAGIN